MSSRVCILMMPAILLLMGNPALADAVPGPHVTVAAQKFLASGPVTVPSGQVVSVCATRIEEGQGATPMKIVLAIVDASNSRLLAARATALQPGASVCIVTGPSQTAPNGPDQTGTPGLVMGIVVPTGVIKQGRTQDSVVIDWVGPGGGCIVASLQLQPTPANLLGPTTVYIPMAELKTVVTEQGGSRDDR